MGRDGRSSAMSEGEGLDEEDDDGDDDEEGGAETEEQSGNESEMNEQDEDVSPFVVLNSSILSHSSHVTVCITCENNMTADSTWNNYTLQPLCCVLTHFTGVGQQQMKPSWVESERV